jgi:hypothetical protein
MKFSNLVLLPALIIAGSCFDEPLALLDPTQEQHRKLVEEYLNGIKTTSDEQAAKLKELASSINYSDVVLNRMSNNEDLLIVGVDDIKLNERDKVSALFFIQDGTIVRSNLVSVTRTTRNHNEIITSVLKSRFDSRDFTGRVGFYNVYGEVLFYNAATGGRITENGMISLPQKANQTMER